MDTEGIAEIYLKALDTEGETDAGLLLAKMYCEILGKNLTTNIIVTFRKLNKIYGRKLVFYSILDLPFFENLDTSNIIMLMHYLCKKKLEKEESKTNLSPIDTKRLQEESEKIRKTRPKLRSPF